MAKYTPSDVCRLIDTSPSTLRRWAKRFEHRLSDGAKRRMRRYTDSDLDTLARISSLSREGFTLDQIDARLGDIIDQPGESYRSSAIELPALLREWDDYRGNVNERFDDVDARLQALEKLEAEREREHRKKPWWRKLFGG